MHKFQRQFKSTQRGLSLTGLAGLGVVFALVALIGAKCFPPVTEYFTILKEVKATAHDSSLKNASVGEIRTAFGKRADVAYIKAVTAQDLEITKENDQIVITFAYTEKVPLVWKASILFEFDGSSENR
ncbi:MAG: DUF4845 domain-containing protein [Rhodocyclaceae bacterium]|jgi:hypothetical protein|nr:DUF4845 domain-containing protein [Rhodocyclaceae bacterium]